MCRRCWFQFHLSTLVLLVLSAGGLMWLNFRPREFWVVYRVEMPGGDSTIEVWGRQPGNYFCPEKQPLRLASDVLHRKP